MSIWERMGEKSLIECLILKINLDEHLSHNVMFLNMKNILKITLCLSIMETPGRCVMFFQGILCLLFEKLALNIMILMPNHKKLLGISKTLQTLMSALGTSFFML